MRQRRWAWIVLAALAGCSAPAERPSAAATDSSGNVGIENRRWLLAELNGEPWEIIIGNESVYFELDGAQSRVTGSAPCNRFLGTYELSAGNRLRFGPDIGATRRACAQLDRESEFLAMLVRVDTYVLGGNMLELRRNGAPLARFFAND